MKKSLLLFCLMPFCLAGCQQNISSSSASIDSVWQEEASLKKVSSILSQIDFSSLSSFDFVDRSYAKKNYFNSKYVVTGDASSAIVNYEAQHHYQFHTNDLVDDNVVVKPYRGVENTETIENYRANEQIYTEDGFLYDLFMVNVENESFAHCYPADRYMTIENYLAYPEIVKDTIACFGDLSSAFPESDGWLTPTINIKTENGIESYQVSVDYPGSDLYYAMTYSFDVALNPAQGQIQSLTHSVRYYLNAIDGGFETSTARLTRYSFSNFSFDSKTDFTGTKHTISELPDDKITGKPATKVDVSSYADGALPNDVVEALLANIEAYGKGARQTNYRFLYHDAANVADTNYTTFGDACFEGKMVAYQNDILINDGSIRLVDSSDTPVGEAAPYHIVTVAGDEAVERGAAFTKYISSCYSKVAASLNLDLRAYTGANPLYYPDFQHYISLAKALPSGSTTQDESTAVRTISATKNGNDITLTTRVTISTSRRSSTDDFTFEIQNGSLAFFRYVTTETTEGQTDYVDTYEAKILYAPLTAYQGDPISFDTFTLIVPWRNLYVTYVPQSRS